MIFYKLSKQSPKYDNLTNIFNIKKEIQKGTLTWLRQTTISKSLIIFRLFGNKSNEETPVI